MDYLLKVVENYEDNEFELFCDEILSWQKNINKETLKEAFELSRQ